METTPKIQLTDGMMCSSTFQAPVH